MARAGRGSPNYSAKRRVRPDGYVDLYRPGHPLARRDGYVFEHRLVLFEAGVAIPPRFQVHHRNGVRDDNRLENLGVIRIDAHTRLHAVASRKTHCPHDHEYTEANTYWDRRGWRRCRACNRDRARARVHAVAEHGAAVRPALRAAA